MALNLRPGETIRAQAHIHWVSYARPILTALLVLGFCIFGMVEYLRNNPSQGVLEAWGFLPLAALGFLPLFLRWMQNSARKFIVTDQRIFLEIGLISKYSTEIPLNKINDVSMSQSLFQRLVGAGSITVLTGNDLNTSFDNIAQPDQFREAISQGR